MATAMDSLPVLNTCRGYRPDPDSPKSTRMEFRAPLRTEKVVPIPGGFAIGLFPVNESLKQTPQFRVDINMAGFSILSTVIGKVQIAYLSEEELGKSGVLDNMDKFTENTIVDRVEYVKHLKEVAEWGYALDNEEYNPEVRCVGVPIRDYTGRVVGGISVSGPSFRMTDEVLKGKIISVVKDAGERISKGLGFGA